MMRVQVMMQIPIDGARMQRKRRLIAVLQCLAHLLMLQLIVMLLLLLLPRLDVGTWRRRRSFIHCTTV